MLTPLLAALLGVLSFSYCLRTLRDVYARRRLPPEVDAMELGLMQREIALKLALSLRSVQALSRANLFAGTGLAVWALTGGSAHHLEAGLAFGLGLLGWGACGEVARRVGHVAKSHRSGLRRSPAPGAASSNQQGDKARGTG